MLISALSVSLLALGAAQVRPAQVPARGRQEAIVTLDRPQMVRIAGQSANGTACELTDHLRGPFAQAGQAGRKDCTLELLLDAGTYKLRLDSPRKGKGAVKLAITPFEELNQPVLRLDARRRTEQVIHPGQQASYWIHLDKRQPVALLVAGRTPGEVALWRNGEWREELQARHAVENARPGQSIHRWVLEGILEAGNYLLTAYGANAATWTQGQPDDKVELAFGFAAGGPERAAVLTLPFSGQAFLELPEGPQVAVTTLGAPPPVPVALTLYPIAEDGRSIFSRLEASCTIEAKQRVPTCATQASAKGRHVLEVKGPPGTGLELAWGPFSTGFFEDGAFGSPDQTLTFIAPHSGDFLVAAHDLQADPDGAPMSCQLERVRPDESSEPIAYDFLRIGDNRPFSRAFNYRASETIWFELTDPGLYQFTTAGDRRSHCELFHFEGADRKRLTDGDPNATPCKMSKLLMPGRYELRLTGGDPGIERLTIARRSGPVPDSATKSACRFDRVSLAAKEKYRLVLNRVGTVVARGLVLRDRPLTMTQPLPVRLERGETVSLPVAAGAPLRVSTVGGGTFRCALASGAAAVDAQEGHCTLPARAAADTLTLVNRAPEGLTLNAQAVAPSPPLPPLAPFSPRLAPLPTLALDTPVWRDFDREERHSFTFDVREAGLYDVTTTGLLATACELRTAIISKLALNNGGGRGRNCLLANYLRPGQYLLTVRTEGQSRGRAGVVLHREPILELAPVTGAGQAFFRAGPGQLVQERLSVKYAGAYRLATKALGANLQCRLEDWDGWPVVAVPTPCAASQQLEPGNYLWMQLPLTVASMRHTSLETLRPTLPLSGNKPHELALNRCYDARLSGKGEDEYRFALQAPTDLHVLLTRRMQGRLYRLEADGSRKPVEVIAPQDLGSEAAPAQDANEGEASAAESPPEDAPPPESSEGEEGQGEGQGGEGRSAEGSRRPSSPCPGASARPGGAPLPPGTVVSLPPGKYALLAQHSRGDVGVAYHVQLGTEVLAPGVALDLGAPATVMLRMPQDGTLRLRTEGDTDVRCRIFDAGGRLRHESSENGDDWNCALAEPLTAGDYRLVIESETQVPGPTRVVAALPPVEDLGTLENGKVLSLQGNVAAGVLPPLAHDGVREMVLRSDQRFSCALENPNGTLVHRETQVTTCSLLLRPGPGAWRLRAWTLERPAQVTVTLGSRDLVDGSRTLSPETAARITLPHPGRYQTGTGVRCLPDAERGVLRPCGPEVSLEAGTVVFAAPSGRDAAKLSPEELIPGLDGARTVPFRLERRPFIQRQSSGEAVQLVAVRAEPGERAAPACTLDPGARTLADGACFAASAVGREALLRAWAPSDDAVAGSLERLAAPYPRETIALAPGRSHYALPGPQARLRAPERAWRAELTLPPGAWAVALDPARQATDLCPPHDALSACALEGVGGEIFVHAPKEPELDAELLLLAQTPQPLALSALYEARQPRPGSLRMTVPPGNTDRTLEIEGALRCAVRRDDGFRGTGCSALLPAGLGAVVLVQHDAGAVRATVHTGGGASARFGPAPEPGRPEPLPAALAAPVSGALVQKALTLDREQVVRVRSESGVCGLWSGSTLLAQGGLDAGCDVSRLLGPGTYRLAVRRFADLPLSGTVAWTGEAVEELKEGVGPERWVAPGEQRTFRFTTASAGRVGLGLQVGADTLECEVRTPDSALLGTGCQQFLQLPAGNFLLAIRAPAQSPAMRFRPVVLGLAGADTGVPEAYLRDFFTRIGGAP